MRPATVHTGRVISLSHTPLFAHPHAHVGVNGHRRRSLRARSVGAAAPGGEQLSERERAGILPEASHQSHIAADSAASSLNVADSALHPTQQTIQGLLDKDLNFQDVYAGTNGLPGIVTVPAVLPSSPTSSPSSSLSDESIKLQSTGPTGASPTELTEKLVSQVGANLFAKELSARPTPTSAQPHHTHHNHTNHTHSHHNRTAPRPAKTIPPPVIADDKLGPDQATVGSWKWNVANAKKLLAFMIPAGTVPMADPLQTMIDTVCIGQFGTAAALASLGPANVVFGFTQYLFASLQTAALSIISARLGQGDNKAAQSVFSSALCLAVSFGTISMLVFENLAPTLIGLTGVDSSLIPLCAEYLRIRALAQPAVLLNMVLNSCLLAQRNVAAPMTSVFLTSFISLMGNLVFVGLMGWGVSGAAITTVASQYIGCMILATSAAKSGKLRPLPKIPTLSEMKMILGTLGPLSIVYTCKNVSYMLVYTTATSLNTFALAAHQALLALWNMCAFTTTPFESAALTFYPNSGSNMQKNSFTRLLLVMGLFNGLIIGLIGGTVALLGPTMLTSESMLWPLISSVSVQLPITLCLVGVDMAAAGLLFARGDFNYLARSYLLTLTLLAGYLFTFCQPGCGLVGIWWALVFFQSVRAVQSAGRLFVLGGVELPFWSKKGAYAA